MELGSPRRLAASVCPDSSLPSPAASGLPSRFFNFAYPETRFSSSRKISAVLVLPNKPAAVPSPPIEGIPISGARIQIESSRLTRTSLSRLYAPPVRRSRSRRFSLDLCLGRVGRLKFFHSRYHNSQLSLQPLVLLMGFSTTPLFLDVLLSCFQLILSELRPLRDGLDLVSQR